MNRHDLRNVTRVLLDRMQRGVEHRPLAIAVTTVLEQKEDERWYAWEGAYD